MDRELWVANGSAVAFTKSALRIAYFLLMALVAQ